MPYCCDFFLQKCLIQQGLITAAMHQTLHLIIVCHNNNFQYRPSKFTYVFACVFNFHEDEFPDRKMTPTFVMLAVTVFGTVLG